MEMRKTKNKSIVIGILCCMLVFMGVGYAAISQTLIITGTGNATGKFDIYIKSIVLNTANTRTSSINASQMQEEGNAGTTSATEGYFNAILNEPGDYATFDITVENRGTIDAILSSYTRTATPDNTLSSYLNGASYNTYFTMSNPFDDESKRELAPGESVVYSIRVDYKQNATSIPEGSLQVEMKLNYIQKAAQSNTPDSGGGSGENPSGGDTSLDFTLDSNGIVIAYDESQVIDNDGYMVVGATNSDGDQITGVNSNSFLQSNVTIYTETDELSEDEITTYVVEDEENFNSIKGVIESVANTNSTTKGIKVQRLGTVKTKVVRRSQYSGSGVGVKKFVNTTTRQITNPVVTITKLDLSGAINITSIGEGVFEGVGLTHLKLGSSLISIGSNAFKSNSISTITIPGSVTTIGDGAFAQNSFADSSAITIQESGNNDQYRFNERWTVIGFPGSGPEVVEERPEPTAASCFTFNSSTGTITAYKTTATCPKDVVIPDEINDVPVTKIGASAFKTKSLTSVYIPYGIEEIQDGGTASSGAFTGNTTTLESITFENTASHPSHLKKIGQAAFRSANVSNKLTGTLTIPASVETIGAYAFYYSKYSSLIIENTSAKPSQLTTIGNSAFVTTTSATTKMTGALTIPASVETIGTNAFQYQQITSLTIENTSAKPSQLTSIGNFAFGTNTLLTGSLTIPASVTTIGNQAFYYANLTSLTIENTSAKPSQLTSIGASAFNENTALTGSLTIPPSVQTIGDNAFYDANLTSLTIENTSAKPSQLTSIGAGAFNENTALTGLLTIPASVQTIGDNAFYYANLTSLTIENTSSKPSQLTSIGNYAFRTNTLLTGSLTIPASVQTIGTQAFFDSSLTSLTIENTSSKPSQLTTIGTGAFVRNTLLTGSLTIPASVQTIGDNAFSDAKFTSLIFEDTVSNSSQLTSIGYSAFQNNRFRRLTIPASVTTIEPGAFLGNSFTIADDITIEYNETNLETRFDNVWAEIGFPEKGLVKYGCYIINPSYPRTIQKYDIECGTNVEIPSEINGVTIQTIEHEAFYNKGLVSVTIPNTVNRINRDAFGLNQLSSVTIPSSVTTIEYDAFKNNQITSVTFEDTQDHPSSVTTIESDAFQNNQITSVTIPASVQTIGGHAFEGNQLTTVTFENTASHPSHLTTIGYQTFRNNQLTSVTIPSSVTTIGDDAFQNNQITSVTFEDTQDHPSGLTQIGASSFRNNQLTSLVIPGSVTTIRDYAFYDNPDLTTIVIKRADSTGMTLGTSWNGTATVVHDPTYGE